MILESPKAEKLTKSSHMWLWIMFFVISTMALLSAVYFFYRRRGFHTNFNIDMYFRNNEIFNELSSRVNSKSSPQPASNYPRVPPTIIEKMGKNYEVINNDSNTPSSYVSMNQMHLSDEEFTEVEYGNNDQTRLIA